MLYPIHGALNAFEGISSSLDPAIAKPQYDEVLSSPPRATAPAEIKNLEPRIVEIKISEPQANDKAKDKKENEEPIETADPPMKLPTIARKQSSPPPQKRQKPEKPKDVERATQIVNITHSAQPVERPKSPKPQQPTDLNVMHLKHANEGILSAKMKFPKTKIELPKETRIMFSDMIVRELTPGKHTVVIVNSNLETKCFTVMELFDGLQKNLLSIETAIQQSLSKEAPTSYEPKSEEMILAKFEEVFYRAVVLEKDKKGYLVLFVDYGNMETIQATDIKPIDKSLTMEIMANEVELENLPVPLTKKAQMILSDENGLEINVKKDRSATGGYIADIIGL